jgi:hypothetical protein
VKLRHSLIAALLAASFIAAALAPAATAKASADFVGVTAEDVFAGNVDYRTTNLSAQAEIGIRLERQTFNWKQIETAPGRFDLSYYDVYVAKLAAHGIRVLPVLFDTPRFHVRAQRGRSACEPEENADFARFAAILVWRYGPQGTLWRERPNLPKIPIHSWEVWNEPTLPAYSCGRPSARRYARMLRSVGRAIKGLDPHAEVVSAGLPASKLRSAVPLSRYLKSLYRAGAARYFDTLAINSYARNKRELARLLRRVRRLMNRHHDRRTPIWITEIGWGDKGLKHRFIVGAKGQGRRVKNSIAYVRRARRRLRLRGFVYFSWRDSAPYPPRFRNLWGLHTGLLNRDGQPKAAFWAFKRSVSALR